MSNLDCCDPLKPAPPVSIEYPSYGNPAAVTPTSPQPKTEHFVASFDANSNDPLDIATTIEPNDISIQNYSDNHIRATLVIDGNSEVFHILPNASENYDFDGLVISDISIEVVESPTVGSIVDPSTLTASTTTEGGYVDINLVRGSGD